MFTNDIYLIYMNKPDLALNNRQGLIYHKSKPTCFPSTNYSSKDKEDMLGPVFANQQRLTFITSVQTLDAS